MPVEIVMPQLGESVVEGTIARWLVKEGDTVARDQPLVEVETDKANTEVPSPSAGVVTRLVASAGEVVPTGRVIAVIEPSGGSAAASSAAPAAAAAQTPAQATPSEPAKAAETAGDGAADRGYSPAVRKAAREQGVDLSRVKGTGENGRVTRKDVVAYAAGAQRSETAAASGSSAPAPAAPAPPAKPALTAAPAPIPVPTGARQGGFRLPPYVPRPGDEVVQFSRRRRLIADHMVFSKQTAPHVAVVAEIDMARAVAYREANRDAWKREGVGLTFLPIVASAAARAVREFPKMNSRVMDDAYVLLHDVNLGIAVETDEGLIVPVIRQADEKTLKGLARAIDEAAAKARAGTLTPDDVSGGTFSLSNPGRHGNLFGTAILSQPQVGILRMGEIVKRPVVIEVGGEDHIVVRPMMYVCLSYDHRIIDGLYGNQFLHRLRELIESGAGME